MTLTTYPILSGSPAFTQQVRSALESLSVLGRTDIDRCIEAIATISEDGQEFLAFCDANGHVVIGSPVALWPHLSPEMQVKVLATYIAHEGVHALLVELGSEEWNTGKGEKLAMDLQRDVAGELDVPPDYVVQPEKTLTLTDRIEFQPSSLTKVGALVLAAIGSIAMAKVLRDL